MLTALGEGCLMDRGTEQKGKGLMQVDDNVVIASAAGIKGLCGH